MLTLPETNSQFAPENGWVGRRSFPFGMAYFQGRTVSFREGKSIKEFHLPCTELQELLVYPCVSLRLWILKEDIIYIQMDILSLSR